MCIRDRVWIDPDWYAGQDSPDQLPSPGLPRVVGLRKRTLLIGARAAAAASRRTSTASPTPAFRAGTPN